MGGVLPCATRQNWFRGADQTELSDPCSMAWARSAVSGIVDLEEFRCSDTNVDASGPPLAHHIRPFSILALLATVSTSNHHHLIRKFLVKGPGAETEKEGN